MKKSNSPARRLPAQRVEELLEILRIRFEKNVNRHPDVAWKEVESKLTESPEKLWFVNEMEETGGEPDVVVLDSVGKELLYVDCAAESPKGRRSLCYDQNAWNSRKEHKPSGSAMEMAKDMGVELLNEEQYRDLQKFGTFDQKTSSWLYTPDSIRALGGSIFGDWRFGRTFIYHNGAESYYGSRGFRGMLKL